METMETSSGTSLEPAFMNKWIERYVDLWNGHDVEGIVSLYTEDVIYFSPDYVEHIHGHSELRGFLRVTFGAFPDIAVEPVGCLYLSPERPSAAYAYRYTATMLGDWQALNVAATGARVSGQGVSCWDFRREQVCRYITYFDTLGVSRQLGILPPPESSTGRLMARAQHVQARAQRRRNARVSD